MMNVTGPRTHRALLGALLIGSLIALDAASFAAAPARVTQAATIAAAVAPPVASLSAYGRTDATVAAAGTPVAPVLKAIITAVPATVSRGGSVAVSGANFVPGETVLLSFYAAPRVVTPATAGATGLLPATTVLVPYNIGVGPHHLIARGTVSRHSAVTIIDIQALAPRLTLGAATVKAGEVETVTGSGFGPSERVALTLNGAALATTPPAVVAAAGAFNATFVVPGAVRAGANALRAIGASSHASSTVTLTGAPVAPAVKAAITAVPATVNRGGLVTVSGANFAPGETVLLYFSADPKVVTPAKADSNGLLPPTGVTIPYAIGAGVHHLVAVGVTSKRSAMTTLTIENIAPRIVLSVASVKPGAVETVSGSGFGAHERVTLALNGAALETTPPVIVTSNGAFSASFVVPTRLLNGGNTISAVGNGSRVTAVAPLSGVLPTAARFYFAGGQNTATAHSFVDILNRNNEPASVALTFYFDSGAVGNVRDTVPAHSKRVISVAGYHFPPGTFGLYLRANRSIAAQIVINRDGQDGDSLIGNTGLGTRWYLAEGYTGLTFHETVSVLNVYPTPATVRLQILPLGGGQTKTDTVTVAPHSSLVTDINALAPGQSVSIIATSSLPVVVERTLTFSSNGYGLTTSAGSNTPATSWLFAEGTTVNRFETFLTILNPNALPARVTASFFGANGISLGSRTLTVPGLSRANLKENDFLNASGIAAVVTSDLPVVVERPEYFGSPNDAGIAGSDVFGQNGASVRASFPDGDTNGHSEFLLVYNPSGVTEPIDVTFYGSNGALVTKRIEAPPTVRYTIDVGAFAPGFDPTHGASLRSVSGLGFVAEQTVFAPDHSTLRSTAALAQ